MTTRRLFMQSIVLANREPTDFRFVRDSGRTRTRRGGRSRAFCRFFNL